MSFPLEWWSFVYLNHWKILRLNDAMALICQLVENEQIFAETYHYLHLAHSSNCRLAKFVTNFSICFLYCLGEIEPTQQQFTDKMIISILLGLQRNALLQYAIKRFTNIVRREKKSEEENDGTCEANLGSLQGWQVRSAIKFLFSLIFILCLRIAFDNVHNKNRRRRRKKDWHASSADASAAWNHKLSIRNTQTVYPINTIVDRNKRAEKICIDDAIFMHLALSFI